MKKLKLFTSALKLLFKIEGDLVLVWIVDRLCLIEAKKAFLYQQALDQGVSFTSSEHFERWYERVVESPFPIAKNRVEKEYFHEAPDGKRVYLMWSQ